MARGIIGMLDTSSKTTQLHKESPENRFNAIAVDSIEQ